MLLLWFALVAAQDSVAIHRAARDAQATFERSRRAQLPLAAWVGSGGARCQERIGRFCYWYSPDDPPPPPEPDAIGRARTRLLAVLGTAAAALPGDGWIAGQRVRYFIDATQADSATAAARACRAPAVECLALLGLARHAADDVVEANAVFDQLLALLPPEERCAWADLTPLLPPADARALRRLSCSDRLDETERLLSLARPLLARNGNGFRAEFFARQVMAGLAEGTATPYGTRFGADQREMLLRYGWPVTWSRGWSPDITREAAVVGHDPTPAWVFLPTDRDGPHWELNAERARARFRPREIEALRDFPEAQVARFPRGDGVLLVARWSPPSDPTFNTPDAGAVLAAGWVAPGAGVHTATAVVHTGRGTLWLPEAPDVAGVELFAAGETVWARHREAWRDPWPAAGPRVSDPLLFMPVAGVPQRLEEVLPLALAGAVVPRGARIGVYWEGDGIPSAVPEVEVAMRVVRERDARPLLAWQWTEPLGGDGRIARAVALDLAELGRGVYRVEITLRAGDEPARGFRRLIIK